MCFVKICALVLDIGARTVELILPKGIAHDEICRIGKSNKKSSSEYDVLYTCECNYFPLLN